MIKFSHSIKTVQSYIQNVVGYLCRGIFKSFSKFNHYFSLFFLANKERQNSLTNRKNFSFICNPFKFGFPMRISFAISAINKTSKMCVKPINEPFISINDINSRVKMSRTFIVMTNVKGAFTIHYSSKINNLLFSFHDHPRLFSLRLTQLGLFSNSHPQRLSERDSIILMG